MRTPEMNEARPADTAKPRWLTCTPRDFVGDERFFARDSGLLCRGFQRLGVSCRAVMPGVARADDAADLWRAERAQLESAGWWRDHCERGVVLYAWGMGNHAPIAAAIRAAGLLLVTNQDSSGAVGPLAGWRDWVADLWWRNGGARHWPRFLAKVAYGHTLALATVDLGRASHFRQADWIGAVSPAAVSRYRRLSRWYGGSSLATAVRLIPHPVDERYRFGAESRKSEVVMAVGRWDDFRQKRPDLLAGVIENLAVRRAGVRFRIFGKPGEWLDRWFEGLAPELKERVDMAGQVTPEVLEAAYREAKVFLCTSAYEGAQLSAQEALCSGASVVAADLASMVCFRWFVSEASGTLAGALRVGCLADAAEAELAAWDGKRRDPMAISRVWAGRLHSGAVARRILGLAGEDSPDGPR